MSLKRYRVTFYYLATGQDGVADERDYGEFVATLPELAIEEAIKTKASYMTSREQEFLRSCLSAEQVSFN